MMMEFNLLMMNSLLFLGDIDDGFPQFVILKECINKCNVMFSNAYTILRK
jgi:hypothetical protein